MSLGMVVSQVGSTNASNLANNYYVIVSQVSSTNESNPATNHCAA